jgi:benzodiazapine receptor
MNRPLATAIGSVLGAAVIGNSCIRKDDLAWMGALNRPRMQISVPTFATVGVMYYVLIGIVIYRACDRRDKMATRLALVVLVLNEVWNVAFFRFRSVRNGFVGILMFVLPLGALQRAASTDLPSAVVLAPYTAWVIGYDVPWTFALWRLNTLSRRHSIGAGCRSSCESEDSPENTVRLRCRQRSSDCGSSSRMNR